MGQSGKDERLENQAAGQPFTYQRQTLHTLDHRLERFSLRLPERRLPAEFSLAQDGDRACVAFAVGR